MDFDVRLYAHNGCFQKVTYALLRANEVVEVGS